MKVTYRHQENEKIGRVFKQVRYIIIGLQVSPSNALAGP